MYSRTIYGNQATTDLPAIGLSAGEYYLRIESTNYFYAKSRDTYGICVNYETSDLWEKEFNETIVTSNKISPNVEISGTIRSDSDVDWYAFVNDR